MGEVDVLGDTGQSVMFNPDNEPYLGRVLLYHFDQIIISSLETSGHVAAWTRAHRRDRTELQEAAVEIIPQGISIALAIRELIRQAYLFPALVLLRPLVERASTISYLTDHPDAVALWKNGWPRRSRPSLRTMAQYASGQSEHSGPTIDMLNHILHGDPYSTAFNLAGVADVAYVVGKDLANSDLCDLVASVSYSMLIVLQSSARLIFDVL